MWLDGILVARWTCDQQVAVRRRCFGYNLGQAVRTYVPLSPSSINFVPAQAGTVTVGLASHKR